MGIIASLLNTLLFISNLFFCNNFVLVEKNIVLHVLKWVKNT